MTEQQKLDLNAEITGFTPTKLYSYTAGVIGLLFLFYLAYADLKKDNGDLKDQMQALREEIRLVKQLQATEAKQTERRIDKLETLHSK